MSQSSDIESRLELLGSRLSQRPSCAETVLESISRPANRRPLYPTEESCGRSRLAGAIATAACIVLVVCWLAIGRGSTAAAFERVKTALQEIESVIVSMQSKSQPEVDCRILILNSGKSRQEFDAGLVRIYDPDKKKLLGLDPETKTAWYIDGEDDWDVRSVIRRIQDAKESAIKQLGERIVDGKAQIGFIVTENQDSPLRSELWVDKETNLPAEMVETAADPRDTVNSHHQVSVRFEFNTEIESELFELAPPEDYEIVEFGPLQPSPPAPRGKVENTLVIKPGIGIGSLTWGDDMADIKAVYGAPSEILYFYLVAGESRASRQRPADSEIEYYSATYNALGLELRFRDETGLFHVIGLEAFSAVGQRAFSGKTEEGIGPGDDKADVLKTYGEPSRVRGAAESPLVLIYEELGLAIGLDEDHVTGISARQPKDVK